MIRILRRQHREISRESAVWSLAVAALLLASALGCSRTPAATGRPPNAPGQAGHPPRASAAGLQGVLLDIPTSDAEAKNPNDAITLIGQHAVTVERELRVARGRHDTWTTDCINDKLNQIHAQERMGQDQSQMLAEAESSSNAAREHQARVMLGVARDRAAKLARQADRCGARVTNGNSEVDVEVDRSRTPSASRGPMPVVPAR